MGETPRQAREKKQEDHEIEPTGHDKEVLEDSDDMNSELQNEEIENAGQF